MNALAVAQRHYDNMCPDDDEIPESAWIDAILTVEAKIIASHDVGELLETLVDSADAMTRLLHKTDRTKLLHNDEHQLQTLSRALNALRERVLQEVDL